MKKKKKLITLLISFSLVISVAAAPFLIKQVAAVDTTGSESQNEESGEQYDTEKPVIESITVDKQGETVSSGESVKVSVSAYDTGVGIESFYYSLYGESFGPRPYNLTFNEETNRYESTIEIDESMGKGKYNIGEIVAVDYNGNYLRGVVSSNGDTYTNADDALYWYQVNNEIKDEIIEDIPIFTINSVSLMKDGVEVTTKDALNVNDTVHVSVKLSGDVDLLDEVRVDFYTEDSMSSGNGNRYINARLYYQENSQSWEGDFSITEDCFPGEYYIAGIPLMLKTGWNYNCQYDDDILNVVRLSIINDDYDKEAPVVHFLSLEKNNEVVHVGDCVTFEAVITDNVKINDAYIDLNAAADIYYGSSRTIHLSQIEDTDVYQGIIEITDDMYPCEWFLSWLNVNDTNGNSIFLSTEPETEIPLEDAYYINVVNGSSFVSPTYNLILEYVAENGDILTKEVKNVPRRTTAQELADNYFMPQHSVLKFISWDVPCGIRYDNYISAKYSNVMVRLYVDGVLLETKGVNKGESINLPKEAEGYETITWDQANNDTIEIDKDADYAVLDVYGYSVKKPDKTEEPSKTDSPEQPTEKPDETKEPEQPTEKPDETKEPEEVTQEPINTKDPDETKEPEQPTEKPDETKEPEEVTQEPINTKDPDETKEPEQPTEKPDKTKEPEQPTEKPDETKEPEQPTEKPIETVPPASMPKVLSQQQIKDVINEINTKETGGNVEVTMEDATVAPKDILEAIKGRDVNVVLKMDGYSWTINGKSVLSENLTDINLEVIRNTNYIPSKLISALAGNNPVEQISLTHQGNFGFTASLTLDVDKKYAGQYGNLYYYDSDGVMKFINAGLIGDDGKVSLEFSHASDYALVISANAAQIQNSAKPEQKAEANIENNKVNSSKSPTTGDTAPLERTLVLMAFAMITVIMIALKKRKTNKD